MQTPKIMLFGAAGAFALSLALSAARAAPMVSIPAEGLRAALDDYIRQSGVQLI